MDEATEKAILTNIVAEAEQLLAQLPTDNSITVNAGDDLQAALDKGGIINLADGATFSGSFTAKVSGTRIVGAKATLVGPSTGPALFIPPGSSDIQAIIGQATTVWDQRVFLIGNSDNTQTTVEDSPINIQLTAYVPTHRGKTAFFINGRDVRLINCGCADVYDPALRDSQAIAILNAPGPILVDGGTFEAASENILVGGDVTAIPNLIPTGLTFQNLSLIKRAAWRTGGPPVKNNFELKNGTNVTFKNSKIDGNWVSGQAGSSIVLTPRNGGTIANILIQDITQINVEHSINMLGQDDSAYSPQMVNVTFQRLNATTNNRFLQMQGPFVTVIVDSCIFNGPGNTIYSSADIAWDTPTTNHQAFISKGVKITNNQLACNSYGVMLTNASGGQAYGAHWQDAWPDGIISGNKFIGSTATKMQNNLPSDNTFSAL